MHFAKLQIRRLGRVDYQPTYEAMQVFTDGRKADTPDELWLLQHPRIFTQGRAGKAEHVLAPGDIPVVHADRGGQVTYHGPGQWVLYLLLDLKRSGLGVRSVVDAIENGIIRLLADHGIDSVARPDAPGVYTGGDKIASLGLRVRQRCTYHGLALNVDMDLEPFSRINPCGFSDLGITSMARCLPDQRLDMDSIGEQLIDALTAELALVGHHRL
ncbi:MAG: lipoyl(octanoyl) transferase LipB [Parahaliea sp.]